MQLAKVGKEDVKLPSDVVWKWGVNAVYSQGSYAYLRIPTSRTFTLVTYRLESRQNNGRGRDGMCKCEPYGLASGDRPQHRLQDVRHRLQRKLDWEKWMSERCTYS
jgi:hypothetical protein